MLIEYRMQLLAALLKSGHLHLQTFNPFQNSVQLSADRLFPHGQFMAVVAVVPGGLPCLIELSPRAVPLLKQLLTLDGILLHHFNGN